MNRRDLLAGSISAGLLADGVPAWVRAASAQQQNVVNESAPASVARAAKPKSTTKKTEGGVREAIDEASSTITSPFAGAVTGVHNEWATRGVRMVLALLVYGFGLGYLARVLRVRV